MTPKMCPLRAPKEMFRVVGWDTKEKRYFELPQEDYRDEDDAALRAFDLNKHEHGDVRRFAAIDDTGAFIPKSLLQAHAA